MQARIYRIAMLLFVFAFPLNAREIRWNELAVRATLRSDGSLAVIERHDMVFDGDWNGGERVVDVRRGQSLTVQSVSRMHEEGSVVPLDHGDLSVVGNWQENSGTIRWRSRAPEDPPFRDQRLIYEIAYTLHGVLAEQGDRYLLDHEFVPDELAGAVGRFTLHFDVEEPWRADSELPIRHAATSVTSSDSYQVELTLQRADGSRIEGVQRRLTTLQKIAGIATLLAATSVWFFLWRRHERRAGRFEPLPTFNSDQANEVFESWKPEVLGAAWDEDVGAAEVAAVLARLEAEGKIRSTVAVDSNELAMELLVPRERFQGYDRALVDGLFIDGDHTSTTKVKEHYESKGYNPATEIKDGINEELAQHADWSADRRKYGCFLAMLPWLAGAVIAAVCAFATPAGEEVMIPAILISVFFAVIGGIAAYTTARKPALTHGLVVGWNVLPCLGIAAVVLMIIFSSAVPTLWDLAALLAIVWGSYGSVAIAASTPLSESRLKLRRWLLALRQWTKAELEQSSPRLRDEWMPHILALGLGPHVDQWYVKNGSTGGLPAAIPVSSRSSVSGASPSGPGGTWSGGGTSFGGGGATGSWVAAASTMAAGVASPSSSSGGGGGGGSSSGGGSAGGW